MTTTASSEKNISVVIFCCKSDQYLTRICVASIRYFYEDVNIYLLKDESQGKFSIAEIVNNFNVREIILNNTEFGWGSGRLFFLLHKIDNLGLCLLLDSDTVMIGKVIDSLVNSRSYDASLIINPEYHLNPGTKEYDKIFSPISWVETKFSAYTYPGYTFNSGCMFSKPGIVPTELVAEYFNPQKYPYWNVKTKKYFPCADQSLLNIVIPILAKKKLISLKKKKFMLWSRDKKVEEISIKTIKEGSMPYIIHWAGEGWSHSAKNPNPNTIHHMSRPDILRFFEQQYYSNIKGGWLIYLYRKIKSLLMN
jgi:hypothetical protein